MNPKDRVLITEARVGGDGKPSDGPHTGDEIPVFHQVWVGNDDDGWVALPRVTDVTLPLRQGEIRKAIITVMYPAVDLQGGTPRRRNKQHES